MSLAEIQQGCQEISDRLEALGGKIQDPELGQKIEAAIEQAAKIRVDATSPIRFALVAGFSAGKTRLLESLLGCGGSFPVAEGPSTGNVVEFRLRPEPTAQATRITRHRITFISRGESIDFLAELKRRAIPLAEKEISAAALDKLNRLSPGTSAVWGKAKEWALDAHRQAQTNALRDLSFELYRFAEAFEHCGKIAGETHDVDAQIANAAMVLEKQLQDFRDLDLASLPAPPQLLPEQLPGAITPTVMKQLFPLVRKVVLDLEIPTPLFDLFESNVENIYTLVDSPGLGSAGSSLRDELLCLRELGEVETILVLLDARNPGSGMGKSIFDLLYGMWRETAKDRLLAVVSRFDQLPLDSQNSRSIRDRLADGSGPLGQEEVLTELADTLNAVIGSARATVADSRPDRIALCSSMAHLVKLVERFPQLRLGTAPFLEDELAASQRERLVAECAPWGRIAQRLQSGVEPEAFLGDRYLGDYLADFADDGGVGRLRRLIRDHLQEHGLAQLKQRVSTEFTHLKKVVDELEEDASVPVDEPTAEATSEIRPPLGLGTALREISRAYRSLATELEGDMPRLKIRLHGEVTPIAVDGELETRLIEQIMGWQEWYTLLDSVDPLHNPGQIGIHDPSQSKPASTGSLLDHFLEAEPEETGHRFPTKSDQFYDPFATTIQALNKSLHTTCAEAVGLLLQEHEIRIQDRLGARCDEVFGLMDAATDQLEHGNRTWRSVIGLARRPTQFTDALSSELPIPAKVPDEVIRRVFPLQLGDQSGRVPLTYPWDADIAREYGRILPLFARHQIRVIQTRHVLIQGAKRYIDQTVGDVRGMIRDRLYQTYQRISSKLEEIANAVQ